MCLEKIASQSGSSKQWVENHPVTGKEWLILFNSTFGSSDITAFSWEQAPVYYKLSKQIK